jgi:hypothetical protein
MPWLKCRICSNKFYAKPRHIKFGWGKYCSNKCKYKAQEKGTIKICNYCKKGIYRTPGEINRSKSKLFFCNRSCHASWTNKTLRSEMNNPNWRTGISSYRKTLLQRSKMLKCECCNFKDERVLVVHHKDGNRLNNNLSNLVLLCRNCHYIEHISLR